MKPVYSSPHICSSSSRPPSSNSTNTARIAGGQECRSGRRLCYEADRQPARRCHGLCCFVLSCPGLGCRFPGDIYAVPQAWADGAGVRVAASDHEEAEQHTCGCSGAAAGERRKPESPVEPSFCEVIGIPGASDPENRTNNEAAESSEHG